MTTPNESTESSGPAPLSPLPERELPHDRHRLLREHFMTELRSHGSVPSASPSSLPSLSSSPTPSPSPVPRRRWRRPLLTALATATAVAVGLTVVLLTGDEGTQPPSAASQQTAVELLEDVALAAEHQSVPDGIRDEQFVYIKSKVGYMRVEEGKKSELERIHQREVWLSVDGTRKGLLIEQNELGRMELDRETPGIESNTNYRHLQTLPTDPGKMLEWLHKVSEGGQSEDQATFVLVGDLARESLLPPQVAATLFRAAGRIPGVRVVQDTVDAAGRHGIAVALESEGERTELIFDRKTKEFLGERTVAVEDLVHGPKKGDVTGRSAVLGRSVVDKPGQRP
ncbi:CU044_5270 family protein [Streptomyces sp. N2-109]|uniref:CU044_5270 family protein n=1 Tax=Streptomyces gossypii TaxID=2883101 RepID=A0ABT2JPW8_9ACTN|nr:CU044_5270 family protein [Streptomyces gossypii]MCT2589420.1 CU044_5270 family protein [Streptomyces gossypii]